MHASEMRLFWNRIDKGSTLLDTPGKSVDEMGAPSSLHAVPLYDAKTCTHFGAGMARMLFCKSLQNVIGITHFGVKSPINQIVIGHMSNCPKIME